MTTISRPARLSSSTLRRSLVAAAIAGALLTTAACGSTVQLDGAAAGGLAAADGQTVPGTSLGGVPADGSGLGTPGSADGTGGLGGTGTGSDAGLPGTSGGTGGTTGGTTTGDGTTAPGGTTGDGGTTTPEVPSGGDIAEGEPVTVGFLSTSTSNAESLGYSSGASYADTEMIAALVKEYNAEGGLAGHEIKPVVARTDTGSNNWANEFQAACATMTEDNQVNAVVGYQFIYFDSFESCLANAGVAHFYGGYQPGDVASQRQLTTLVATSSPTVDGANLAALSGAVKTGLIKSGVKVGLLLDTCAHGDRAFASSTKKWLEANRIDYEVATGTCSGGAGDAGSASAQISAAELQFASRGVDLVYAVGIPLLLFMTQAETQGYRPKYVTTSAANVIAGLAPAAQAANLHGFGWAPTLDVALSKQPAQTAAQKTCLGKLAKNGLRPTQYNDFILAYITCDGLDLYAQALAETKSLDAPTVVASAIKALPKFRGSATYGGTLKSGSTQRGGPSVYREARFDSSCRCMAYTGPTYPIPFP